MNRYATQCALSCKSPPPAQHHERHKHVIDQGCQAAYRVIHKSRESSVMKLRCTHWISNGRTAPTHPTATEPRRGIAPQKNTLYSQHPGVYICYLYPRLRKKPKPRLI